MRLYQVCALVVTISLLLSCNDDNTLVRDPKTMLVSGTGGKLINPRLLLATGNVSNGQGDDDFAYIVFLKGTPGMGSATSLAGPNLIDQFAQRMVTSFEFRGNLTTIELLLNDYRLEINGTPVNLARGKLVIAAVDQKGVVVVEKQLKGNTEYQSDMERLLEVLKQTHSDVRAILSEGIASKE